MKKMMIFFIAATLAVLFSAFATHPQKSVTYHWFDSMTGWHDIDEADVCPLGIQTDCVLTLAGTPRQICKSEDLGDKLKYGNP